MGNHAVMERSVAGGRAAQQYRKQFQDSVRTKSAGYGDSGRQGNRVCNTELQVIRQRGVTQQMARQQDMGPDRIGQQSRSRTRAYTAAQRELQRRRRKRRHAVSFLKFAIKLALVFGLLVMIKGGMSLASSLGRDAETRKLSFAGDIMDNDAYADKFGERLAELLERNEETADYVKAYPDRENYQNQSIDLTEDLKAGEVPLLMQWDKRWGYNAYGDNMIGLAGCGPVCLDMAYLYFTGDSAMTPREMAAFAYDNGYYKENVGTMWSLWTEGVGKLGLRGEELPLDEERMEQVLDTGGLIICSMGPGDFTTDGHFILIRGYDENGFFVNDPNRRSNSNRQWDFDTLHSQIRNLWSLYQ